MRVKRVGERGLIKAWDGWFKAAGDRDGDGDVWEREDGDVRFYNDERRGEVMRRVGRVDEVRRSTSFDILNAGLWKMGLLIWVS